MVNKLEMDKNMLFYTRGKNQFSWDQFGKAFGQTFFLSTIQEILLGIGHIYVMYLRNKLSSQKVCAKILKKL